MRWLLLYVKIRTSAPRELMAVALAQTFFLLQCLKKSGFGTVYPCRSLLSLFDPPATAAGFLVLFILHAYQS